MDDEPLHARRGMAESFGVDASRYDRARPSYPDALIAAVTAASPGPEVLDVGVGTGIAARQLVAAGCRVTGVDVDGRMAAFAAAHGVTVEVAPFETWDAGERTFDAVIAAQSWHWVDPVAGLAKATSVLRAGGLLALFWNVMAPPEVVRLALSGVYRDVLGGFDPWAVPMVATYDRHLDELAVGIDASGAFGEIRRWRYDWTRTYTTAEWLEQIQTGGDVASMPPGALDRLVVAVREALDGLGGHVPMGFATMALVAKRR